MTNRFMARLLGAAFTLVGVGLSAGCSATAGDAAGETSSSAGEEITRGARFCAQDSDCNHGVEGLGVICVRSGSNKGKCDDGCHADADCPGGGSCDKSTAHWQCDDPLPKLGTSCADDAFCSGVGTEGFDGRGTAGDFAPDDPAVSDDTERHEPNGRVCSARSHTCIIGCHSNDDCPNGSKCDSSGPTFVCRNGGVGGANDGTGDDSIDPTDPPATGGVVSDNGCPAITYPSGVTLVTVPDAAQTAKYKGLNAASCALPKCFLDLKNLRSPDGKTFDLSVNLSAHFTLDDIVHTEAMGSWSSKVLVDAKLIEKLESMRNATGRQVSISSGFRSPDHQRATCVSICGCAQCVSDGRGGNRCGNGGGRVTCARNSRHMWGAAADLSLAFSSSATRAGFPFVFDEHGGSGPHLHVDMKACR